MDSQNSKNLCPKVFDSCKILKIREIFCFYFYCTMNKLLTEIENGREAQAIELWLLHPFSKSRTNTLKFLNLQIEGYKIGGGKGLLVTL